MKYRELLILLPCHSLDDFPTHHEGDDAAGLLAAWTVLWHPALISSAGQAPQWLRAEEPPNEAGECLIAIPNVAKDRLPTGFTQRAKDQGAVLLRGATERAKLLATALEPLGELSIDADLAADFLALGYAYLQVQLLTRQMRYASNLDDAYFKSQVVLAAQAAHAGDVTLARERLSACFSLLAEERDRFYAVEAFLIDITLTAETTLGSLLRNDLAHDSPANIILSGEHLEQLARSEPESLAKLRERFANESLGLLGGEARERRNSLLSLEDISAELKAGEGIYRTHLDRPCTVFARGRFGMTAALPGLLHNAGFRGALHAAIDDGTTPEGTQIKIGWEGSDGTAIDALARTPLDASLPKTFLQLASKLGESMDADHVATLLLAHWPSRACEFLEDLRRTAKYSACLGKFITVERYFAETAQPGQLDRFAGDRYKSPYLKQSVIRRRPDPISTSVRYWQRRAAWEAAQAMHALADAVSDRPPKASLGLEDRIRRDAESTEDSALAADLETFHTEARARFADTVLSRSADREGILVANPYSCVRRTGVKLARKFKQLPAVESPIYALDQSADAEQFAVVDVPAFGFAWIGESSRPAKIDKRSPVLAEAPNVLRNEFFEAIINPITGALQSIHEYSSRRNRISQQLALRTPGPQPKPGETYRHPDETALYSIPAADAVEVTAANTACGEIKVRGRLLDREGTAQANFTQVFRVWRGSRVLQIEIDLEPLIELKSDPWNHYFASRFAWGDEAALLARSIHRQHASATGGKIESPLYVEIDQADKRTSILCGGLPFHRRSGPAALDSLLIVRGETARSFRIGIGIDVPHPIHEAMALCAPPPQSITVGKEPNGSNSGWLVHVDSRNVVISEIHPVSEQGRVVGLRMSLFEAAGRPADMKLSAFRPFTRARRIDLAGRVIQDCAVEQGKVKLSLSAHGTAEVEAFW